MMKLLWFGNAPWANSGYGKNARNITSRIKDKHEVAVLCNWGLFGGTVDYNGIKCHPGTIPSVSGDEKTFTKSTARNLDKLVEKYKYDATICHFDIWSINDLLYSKVVRSRYIAYAPVDSDPVCPIYVDSIENADEIVTFCDWAGEMLDKLNIKNTVIPHGVDTKIYNPPTKDKSEYKKKLGIPEDCTIFTIVGTNVGPRKGIHEAMEGYGRFLNKHPEARKNTRLYIHSEAFGIDQGFSLVNLGQLFEISENVIFTTQDDYQQVPEEAMADLFRASDVHVLTSHSEGFGMPLIESAACGVPSIATDYTSMTELVNGHGILVRIAVKELQPRNYVYHAIPYTPDITKAFETYWNDPNKIKEDGKKAAEFALGYDWDKVIIPKWLKFLDVYEQKISKK